MRFDTVWIRFGSESKAALACIGGVMKAWSNAIHVCVNDTLEFLCCTVSRQLVDALMFWQPVCFFRQFREPEFMDHDMTWFRRSSEFWQLVQKKWLSLSLSLPSRKTGTPASLPRKLFEFFPSACFSKNSSDNDNGRTAGFWTTMTRIRQRMTKIYL